MKKKKEGHALRIERLCKNFKSKGYRIIEIHSNEINDFKFQEVIKSD